MDEVALDGAHLVGEACEVACRLAAATLPVVGARAVAFLFDDNGDVQVYVADDSAVEALRGALTGDGITGATVAVADMQAALAAPDSGEYAAAPQEKIS